MSLLVLKNRFIYNTLFYMKHETINRKATAKIQPIIKKGSPKTAVAAAKFSEKKVNSSKREKKPVVFAERAEVRLKKNKSNKTAQSLKPTLKPKSKKAEVVAPVKKTKSKTDGATKVKIQKPKTVASVNKTKAAAKKLKLNKAVQTIKPKTKFKSVSSVAAPKSKARKTKLIASAKQIKPAGKKKISSVSIAKKVKKPNAAKVKLNVSEKSTKSKTQKPKSTISIKKVKTVGGKNKQNVIVQKTKKPTINSKLNNTAQVAKPKARRIKPLIPAVKIEVKKTKVESANSSKTVPVKKTKSERRQVKSTAFAKTIKLEKTKVIKAKPKKTEPIVAVKETKAVETETAILPVEKKLKRKKNKPIGAAVFRGRKDRYDFKVFPLDNDFEDVSAIYVISRRKIDRQKKGHHALVCIGQTDSILGEIKRHKNKCIKRHDANVISILPESDLKKRLKIEEDLKSAHTLVCNIG